MFMPFLTAERWPHPPDVEILGLEEAAVSRFPAPVRRDHARPIDTGVVAHGAPDGVAAHNGGIVSIMNGIRERANRRGITRLCHFTPSRNLAHIAQRSQRTSRLSSSARRRDRRLQPDRQEASGRLPEPCVLLDSVSQCMVLPEGAGQREAVSRIGSFSLIDARHLWQAGTKILSAKRGGRVRATRARWRRCLRGPFRRARWQGLVRTAVARSTRISCRRMSRLKILIPDRILPAGRDEGVVVRDDDQAAREASRLRLQDLSVPRMMIVPEFFEPSRR